MTGEKPISPSPSGEGEGAGAMRSITRTGIIRNVQPHPNPSPEGEGLVETKLSANGVYEMERAA